jgi:pyruvate dehydrogenase E2 component (dihydrolipoamide acetyltransferase)
MRRAIASLMTRSAREVPQYHVALRVDLSRTLQWLEDTNLDRPLPERIVPAALLVKAVARAAAQIPELHGFWIDDGFRPADRIAVGLAVSLRGGGLLVPTLYDADRLELGEIMGAMRDLVERARTGRLRATELSGAGITVTNLGDTGVDVVHGLLVPPQVALVGFGRIHDEAWAEHGMVGVRPVVHVSLAGDHRASDGIEGARFLNRIAQLLHEPDRL